MPKYAQEFNRTASLTLAVGSVVSSATVRRIKLYEFNFGSEAAPADNAFLWQIQRCTAAGTSTAVTPTKLDPSDGAALTVAGENHTVSPTLTAGDIPLSIPLNQRSTFRWVAAPGFEILSPATVANGFAIETPTAGALVAVTATLLFEE